MPHLLNRLASTVATSRSRRLLLPNHLNRSWRGVAYWSRQPTQTRLSWHQTGLNVKTSYRSIVLVYPTLYKYQVGAISLNGNPAHVTFWVARDSAWKSAFIRNGRMKHSHHGLGPREYVSTNAVKTYILKAFGMNGGLFRLSYFTPLLIICTILGLVLVVGGLALDKQDSSTSVLSDNQYFWLTFIPTRLLSRVWGYLTHVEVPVLMRKPVYLLYSKLFNCILEEVPKPLNEFPTMNAFFTRRIDPKFRPIDSTLMVSPVDGTVLHFGRVEDGWIEEIKGIRYRLSSLIGDDATSIIQGVKKSTSYYGYPKGDASQSNSLPKNLHYMVIYLAPGDYHGVHSPVNWSIKHSRHFPGNLLSVSRWSTSLIKGLFTINERVVINGTWDHGYFSLTPIGAFNVGSIKLEFDPALSTNLSDQSSTSPHSDWRYNDIFAKKGDCVAFFHLGSTVFLLFETPGDWEWLVNSDDRVKFGQALGKQRSN